MPDLTLFEASVQVRPAAAVKCRLQHRLLWSGSDSRHSACVRLTCPLQCAQWESFSVRTGATEPAMTNQSLPVVLLSLVRCTGFIHPKCMLTLSVDPEFRIAQNVSYTVLCFCSCKCVSVAKTLGLHGVNEMNRTCIQSFASLGARN